MRGWVGVFARDACGAVAPLFALGLIVFLGMGALAWDVSRAYALRAELDAAVDAAALAGATQLDGSAGAMERARIAAQGALVRNSQALANAAENNVAVADADISFLSDLDPRTFTTEDALANFIQIDLTPRQLSLVLGAFTRTSLFNVRAHAVAGYGIAICKIQPLFVCNPAETATVNTFNPNEHIGKGMVLMSSPGNDTWGPGNFGYVSVTGEDGIKEAMGRATPRVQCFGRVVETKPGRVNAANQYFNTRFGYYQGSASGEASDPEFLPSQNTITGRGNNCTPNLPTYTGWLQPGDPDPPTMAPPRDRCGYPGGSCSGPDTSPMGTGEWQKDRYFSVNHDLSINPLPTDWSVYGPNPTHAFGAPTRYQVYKWENSLIAANNTAGFKNTANSTDNYGSSCYTGGTVTPHNPDRRVISVLVADCLDSTGQEQNMNGRSHITVISYMDLFLTEPVDLTGTGSNERLQIYGEIIGGTADISQFEQEKRLYSVRLYE